jgi:putrescine transport system ATP-binding protein
MSSDQPGAGAAAPASSQGPNAGMSGGANAANSDAADQFIQIVDVVKKFGDTVAVKGVNCR